MAKMIDETGNIYTYLTVLKRVENKDNRARWLCKCKCGKEIVVAGKYLRNGYVKSCGCLKTDILIQRNTEKGGDLTGQRFGKLLVIKFDSWKTCSNGKRKRVWECKCDCGNTCYVQHQYLKCGDTTSCGCAHSRGNAIITGILNKKSINYKAEYSDKRFVSSNNGRFYYDFAIFDKGNNLMALIEYQGTIHFSFGTGWNTEEALIERQKRDAEKLNLCKKYNIPLHYITYKENIEERLEEILSEYRNKLN